MTHLSPLYKDYTSDSWDIPWYTTQKRHGPKSQDKFAPSGAFEDTPDTKQLHLPNLSSHPTYNVENW